jgi:serine/threonine-protein kinase HipA
MVSSANGGIVRKNIFVFAHCQVGDPIIAGVLDYDESARMGVFRYAKSYLSRDEAIPLSMQPNFALTASAVSETANEGLPGPIRDAMPDYWGRLVYASRHGVPVEKVSNADILLADVAERTGFLDFSATPEWPCRLSLPGATRQAGGHAPDADIPLLDDVGLLVQTADALAAHQQIPSNGEHALRLLAQGTSMGGARPKSVIRMNNALWLAKFPAKNDHFDVSAVEYAVHQMAFDAGITTPDTHLMQLPDGRHVFMSKRFDRAGHMRVPLVSALTALNLDEFENAKGSYASIANILKQQGDAHGAREMFSRMVFNAFMRNTDDHLRNHAFLFDRVHKAWKASPAYDINPTVSKAGVGEEFDLSINIGRYGRAATLENMESSLSGFGMDFHEFNDVMRSIADVVANWQTYFKAANVDERTISLFSDTFDLTLKKFEVEAILPFDVTQLITKDATNDQSTHYDWRNEED